MDADSKEMAAVAANDSIAPPLNAAANDSNAEAQDAQASGTQTPEQDPEKRPAVFRSTLSEILFITVCTLAIASSSLLAGSVTVISNAVGDDLHMDQAEVTWLFSGPSLACGSFVLMFGRLADLFGRKALFVGSIFLFAVFAMGGALSHSPIVIDTMGGLMGLASAAAVPPAVGSLGNTYPKPSKRKNYVFACFSAGNPLGFVFGTIASGIAALIFNWRASYWLLAIIYLFVTIMAFFTVPPDNTEKLPWNRETLKKFDFVGVLLGVAGLALTTASLTLGGSAPDGWRTGYVIALLVVGVAFLVTFVCYELRYPHPVMPMWIWRDRNFSVLNIVVMLGMSGFTSVLFWVSLYIQRFWTSSAIHVAAYVLPCAIMGTIANVVVGSIMHRFSNKIIFTVASFIYIIAFLLLAVNRDNFGYWPCIFPALMLVVWGADLQFCIANVSTPFLLIVIATNTNSPDIDVCHLVDAPGPTIPRRRHIPDNVPSRLNHRIGHFDRHLQRDLRQSARDRLLRVPEVSALRRRILVRVRRSDHRVRIVFRAQATHAGRCGERGWR